MGRLILLRPEPVPAPLQTRAMGTTSLGMFANLLGTPLHERTLPVVTNLLVLLLILYPRTVADLRGVILHGRTIRAKNL